MRVYEDGLDTGPPTTEDDQWFEVQVVAKGYPKVRRGDKPLNGQRSIFDFTDVDWTEPA